MENDRLIEAYRLIDKTRFAYQAISNEGLFFS